VIFTKHELFENPSFTEGLQGRGETLHVSGRNELISREFGRRQAVLALSRGVPSGKIRWVWEDCGLSWPLQVEHGRIRAPSGRHRPNRQATRSGLL